jgi:FHS family L-fucose permease-like MFS transporter
MNNSLQNNALDAAPIEAPQNSYRFALMILTSLFFLWGFITSLNDILIPYLKGLFELSYFQAQAVNLCFFGAYAVVSYPAGLLVRRLGYKSGIVWGLCLAALGCLLFIPAAHIHVYGLFLCALFVLASGITILQVAANPFVSRLGSAESASFRLNLTQAFNSLGTTVAPIFGGLLILSVGLQPGKSTADAIQIPYLIIFSMLTVLAVTFYCIRLPVIQESDEVLPSGNKGSHAWHHRHLALGVLAIFVYVGAEVSIGSFLVNFLNQENIANMPEEVAAHYVAYYWGGAMVGRFIGASIMLKVRPQYLLTFNALIAVALILITINSTGHLAMWSILAVGLFNSIMFPTIFSLAIHRLGPLTGQASGLLCVAIVGGALIPMVQGYLADTISLQAAFWVPLICYLYIAFYGFKGYRVVE